MSYFCLAVDGGCARAPVKMSERVNACPAAAAAVAAHVRLMSILTTVGKSSFAVTSTYTV